MKWRTDTRKFSDTGTRVVFAWLPVRCVDGMTRWLCFVGRQYRFIGDGPVTCYRELFKGKHHG